MKSFKFPQPFSHGQHPPIRNINDLLTEQRTRGQVIADHVAGVVGSWPFIIIQSGILVLWVLANVLALVQHWDPYPFILMNLFLSLQAAYTAPVIMMSQNRQAERDRVEAHQDFIVNRKAEEEIRAVLAHLEAQDQALAHLVAEVAILRGQSGQTE